MADPHGGRRRYAAQKLWVPGALIIGIVVGLVAPPEADGSGEMPQEYLRISSVIGWTYFFAWSVSFYPQIVLNFARRSVVGLSVEYTVLNLLGFLFYFLFNAVLFWDVHVQDEYQRSYSGHQSAVRLNDVLFAGHAALATAVTLAQIVVYYDYPPLERYDRLLRILVFGVVGVVALVAMIVAVVIWVGHEESLSWLQYLSLLSVTKLCVSVVKYCPQVWMNFQRKSTEGWNIYNVLLDFTGGLLSVMQLLLDCSVQNDWSKITGDPVKLLLGSCSMVFDVVFMFQHYCCYAKGRARRTGALQVSSEGLGTSLPTPSSESLLPASTVSGRGLVENKA
uniref:Cystinosin n=1 Tax=Alexandrium andersonii TaxID=327968 RepID=A0A7S2F7M0_9DINO|mmetsp:Transcript_1915/g.4216  ORF Transcript_1915/g.4216 Transcript_1915/m.4216 type:complete len:336 (+) Transcript_1915:61-1068(+)